MIGATVIVITQMASAMPRLAGGKFDSSSACDSGTIEAGRGALQDAKRDQQFQAGSQARIAATPL